MEETAILPEVWLTAEDFASRSSEAQLRQRVYPSSPGGRQRDSMTIPQDPQQAIYAAFQMTDPVRRANSVGAFADTHSDAALLQAEVATTALEALEHLQRAYALALPAYETHLRTCGDSVHVFPAGSSRPPWRPSSARTQSPTRAVSPTKTQTPPSSAGKTSSPMRLHFPSAPPSPFGSLFRSPSPTKTASFLGSSARSTASVASRPVSAVPPSALSLSMLRGSSAAVLHAAQQRAAMGIFHSAPMSPAEQLRASQHVASPRPASVTGSSAAAAAAAAVADVEAMVAEREKRLDNATFFALHPVGRSPVQLRFAASLRGASSPSTPSSTARVQAAASSPGAAWEVAGNGSSDAI